MAGDPKTQKRKLSSEVNQSCFSLLEQSLKRFSMGQDVGFDEANLEGRYADRNEFYRDCKRIRDKLDEIRGWMEVLGVPLPEIDYRNGRLSIPVRAFATKLSSSLRSEKDELAKRLVACRKPDSKESLLPRGGKIFLGFGTTVLAAAKQIVKYSADPTNRDDDDFSTISILTPNIEILVRYYIFAPRIFRRGSFCLPGVEVDWDNGCVIPLPADRSDENGSNSDDAHDTSLVSFEQVDAEGRFYADTPRKGRLIQQALESTTHRIILVGEKNKFSKKNIVGVRFDVPSDVEVFVVSNTTRPPSLPEQFNYVNLSSHTTARSQDAHISFD